MILASSGMNHYPLQQYVTRFRFKITTIIWKKFNMMSIVIYGELLQHLIQFPVGPTSGFN